MSRETTGCGRSDRGDLSRRHVAGRSVGRLLASLLVAIALAGTLGPETAPADAASLPAWTGGINLYRSGVYTVQKTWWYCTAADVQIMRNIARHETDHSTASQKRYFDYMRKRNRYDIPVRAGVDPAGWTAGLRRHVDDRYRLVASKTFDGALRSAVTRMRQTGLPVALAVAHGNHGWVLHGFTATADPAATKDFAVTSVRVTGPLYGLQSRNGYDMKPNTKLTPTQLKRFFTRWHYDPLPMVWDGLYVSIQPVPSRTKNGIHATADPTPAAVVAAAPAVSPSVVPRLGFDRLGDATAEIAGPLAMAPSSTAPSAPPEPSVRPSAAATVVPPDPTIASSSDVGSTLVAGLATLSALIVASLLVLTTVRHGQDTGNHPRPSAPRR